METTYQRKSVGVSNERFFAGSQNGVAIASRPIPMASGRRADLKGLRHTVQESKPLALSGTMAAVFAHEVANPLNGISVGLELVKRTLERGEFDTGRLIATLRGTMLEIDRLGSLLNEFRDIACPQTIDFQKTDLVKNTKEVLSCQYAAYRKLGITIEVQFKNPLPPVRADADKIKQVVLNLCKNAVEAMPDGGCLTVKGYRFAQMVVLEISDTGAGIPEGLDPFELFRTTKRDGSGLGLPLVRQIVSAHNGIIEYTSKPGHGTTFKIYFPAADLET
jgi:signal transduction histidine kinase